MSTAKKFSSFHDQAHVGVLEMPSMISPIWDMVFAGGLSIAVYLLMNISFRSQAPDNSIALWVFNLSFVMNFPHFLASYQMLYGDFRREITRNMRFFWAAVIVPVLLGLGMMGAFAASSPTMLGYFVSAMYFFVGWHYVKQTFGVIVVGNAYQKIFYNKQERNWLQFNMYALWAASFFAANAGPASYQQMGIYYPSFNFGTIPLNISYALLTISIFGNVFMHFRKYIRDGSRPSGMAIMAYLTIYIWLLPLLMHSMYAHMAPFFHSFQYLLFVYAFRKNKVEDTIQDLPVVEARKQRVLGIWGFFAGSIILGALSFQLIPGFFDHLGLLDTSKFGPTPFVFFATIFINIHHYFIDNVMWKGNNPEIRQYLFKAG